MINFILNEAPKKDDENIDVKKINKNYSGMYEQILQKFGSMYNAFKFCGIKQKVFHKISAEECINDIMDTYEKYHKVSAETLRANGGSSIDVVHKLFGSLPELLKKLNIPLEKHQRRFVSKEEITKEIYRLVEKNGYISKPMMEKESSYNTKIVVRIWGNFTNMYKDLNVPRSKNGIVDSDENIIQDIKRIHEKFGFISKELIIQESKYSTTCILERLGNLSEIKIKLGLIDKINVIPGCSSRSAEYCINKFSKHLNELPIKEKTFDWLRNPITNYKLRLDAYFPHSGIAVEYNGPQHYQVDSAYTKTEKELEYRQFLDKAKIDLCREHGIKVITVHYKDKITKDYIKEKLS